MIQPTVGRVVWFFPNGKAQLDAGEQPHAAIVACVHGDRLVNLMVIGANGHPYSQPSAQLVQDGDETPETAFACWMPYQKGQAAKAEALEKQAAT